MPDSLDARGQKSMPKMSQTAVCHRFSRPTRSRLACSLRLSAPTTGTGRPVLPHLGKHQPILFKHTKHDSQGFLPSLPFFLLCPNFYITLSGGGGGEIRHSAIPPQGQQNLGHFLGDVLQMCTSKHEKHKGRERHNWKGLKAVSLLGAGTR